MDKTSALSVPDVHTLVEGAAGQVLPVGAEGHAVHGFLVLGERVDAHAPLDVPKSDSRIERGARQHDAGVGVAGGRPGGTPLDGVYLFAVCLKVVDTRVLLHTPDLQCHIIRAGG